MLSCTLDVPFNIPRTPPMDKFEKNLKLKFTDMLLMMQLGKEWETQNYQTN